MFVVCLGDRVILATIFVCTPLLNPTQTAVLGNRISRSRSRTQKSRGCHWRRWWRRGCLLVAVVVKLFLSVRCRISFEELPDLVVYCDVFWVILGGLWSWLQEVAALTGWRRTDTSNVAALPSRQQSMLGVRACLLGRIHATKNGIDGTCICCVVAILILENLCGSWWMCVDKC